MKRFIITEDEKKNILKLHKTKIFEEWNLIQEIDLPEVVVSAPKDVKAFQDWLDTNKPGWTTGKNYKTISKKPERGYGKYGPLTKAAWNKYKGEYQPNQSQLASSASTSATTASTVLSTASTTASTSGSTTGTTVTTGAEVNPLPGLNNIQDKTLQDAVLAWSTTPDGKYIISLPAEQRESGLDQLEKRKGPNQETRRLKNEIRLALGMRADNIFGRVKQGAQGFRQGFQGGQTA